MSKRRPQSETFMILAVVRILIASYFLAIGVGFVKDATISGVTTALLRPEFSILAAHSIVFLCAFAIMVGKCVRGGALLLAGFMFVSTWAQKASHPTDVSLQAIWLNALLIAVLLLIAITTPGGSSSLHLKKRAPVKPRRVRPSATPAERPVAEPTPSPRTIPMFTSSRTAEPEPKRPTLRVVRQDNQDTDTATHLQAVAR